MDPRSLKPWRVAQTLLWVGGAGIVAALLWAPALGIDLFWNILIPAAPALLVFLPGVWRNICPLASTALIARHTGRSKRRKLPRAWQGRLALMGVVLLYAIVPLRHVVLDQNGPATAVILLALAAVAVAMGSLFEWKSGWCSGLCPVHPVEKLYGTQPLLTPPNAHCGLCEACVQPCPDSTNGLHPLAVENGRPRRWAGLLMLGGFPGFIWGWFQVPDYAGREGFRHLQTAYGYPLAAAAATLALLVLLERLAGRRARPLLFRAFAAAAVGCYYWYRLPALFGFGPFPGDGMLVDWRTTLPPSFPAWSHAATTAIFAAWFLLRRGAKRAWLVRPTAA